MSAVPVAVLAFGGTSDLALSVALNFSAEAGPASSTAAVNANAANMVLVMVLSLLCHHDFTTMDFTGLFPKNRRSRHKSWHKSMTGVTAAPAIRLRSAGTEGQDGRPG